MGPWAWQRAAAARDAEAVTSIQHRVKTVGGSARLARDDPYALVGWRVSVYWPGEEEGAGDGWYTGQVTNFAPTDTAVGGGGAEDDDEFIFDEYGIGGF